jgi:hypothetical protein
LVLARHVLEERRVAVDLYGDAKLITSGHASDCEERVGAWPGESQLDVAGRHVRQHERAVRIDGAVRLVPTTVTMRPGPVSEAKPPPPSESALSAAPVIEPLMVAPFPMVVSLWYLTVALARWRGRSACAGADGGPISDKRMITFLKFTVSASV